MLKFEIQFFLLALFLGFFYLYTMKSDHDIVVKNKPKKVTFVDENGKCYNNQMEDIPCMFDPKNIN